MFGRLGMTEVLLIVLAIVLIFGASKLPQLGRSIGDGIREFKKSVKDDPSDSTDKK